MSKQNLIEWLHIAYRKVYLWNMKRNCNHQLTTEVFRCYQDRYVKEQCNTCNKELYFDL